ncbi:hypothetical protein MSG28_010622 [Choristoneura fumiferana]|uniref:Uncharacterized protein n=1 Tax=Choristoneura fumiferana TaxID=7141 RepID=A0ACC0KP82_CHOFU|nr:hypothetical protein MSG28_010622 [Choristoneura fumiferana]
MIFSKIADIAGCNALLAAPASAPPHPTQHVPDVRAPRSSTPCSITLIYRPWLHDKQISTGNDSFTDHGFHDKHIKVEGFIWGVATKDLADDLGDDKGITEHLKLPIQRINDYQLLLKELVKYSKRLGEDCTDLQKALELFLGVPNRATDNKFIASIEGYRGNIYKLGRLLTHDWFTVTDADGKSKERYLFLFKARVLICKVKRVSDDRSVFVLKDIIKLPEVEVNELASEPLKFELHQKSPPLSVTLAAHKEQIKNNWLKEILQNISDVVALAEHAADDLQVLSQEKPEVISPEPTEEKTKKREHTEDVKAEEVQEKRTKVEVVDKKAKVEETNEVLTREQSLQQLKAKRKASIENEAARKVSKTEVADVVSEKVTSAKSEVTSDLETKSSVTHESSIVSGSTIKAGKKSGKAEIIEESVQSSVTSKSSVHVSSVEQSSEETVVQRSSVEQTVQSSYEVSSEQASVQSSSVEQKSSQATVVEQKLSEATVEQASSAAVTEQKSAQTSSAEKKTSQATTDEQKTQSSTQETLISSTEKESQESFQTSVAQSTQKSEETVQQSTTVESKVGTSTTGETTEEGKASSQTVEDDEMSRYNRSSRLSGEYSSSSRKLSSGGRYESSAYESSGYSRRESGSQIEASQEGSAYSRYESKYSSSTVDGSKNAIEVESETTSKLDSIAAKYGIGNGRNETSIESSYESAKTGTESKYSKLANGSISSGEYQSVKISKSEFQDGKPVFSKTLEGQNIEPGENASFECAVRSSEAVKVTWLKDNKTFPDRLMDRCSITDVDGNHKLYLQHCREDDSGLYTAMVENTKGNAHCTAQLVVHELTAEERRERNALNAPYFLVALKDTEIMENTYLRFMVKVKGDPNPEVKFFRDGKEIVTSSETDRVSIVRTRADKGCYELVIADVVPADAGVYSCRALNIYGDVTTEAKVTVVDDKNIFFELAPGGEGLLAKGEKPTFSWKRDGEDFDPEERFKERFIYLASLRSQMFPAVLCENSAVGEEVLLGDDEDSLALVFQHVKPEDAGLYTCVAKTSTGNISCSAELTVQGPELIMGSESISGFGTDTGAGFSESDHLSESRIHMSTVVLVFACNFIATGAVYLSCTPLTATFYHVKITGAVTVLHREPEKPQLVIEHREAIVSAGASAMLELTCKGFPKPDIVFKHDGKVIEADTRHKFLYEDDETMSLVIKNVTSADAGIYHVTATNELGEDSTTMQLVVKAAPKIKKKVENQTCMVSSSHTVTIEVEGTPAPEVSFYKDGTEIKSSDRVQIVKESDEVYKIIIKDAKLTDTGSYSVVAKNEVNQCSDFWQWHVTSPPKLTKKLGDAKVCDEKETVTFQIQTEAEPAPTVKW